MFFLVIGIILVNLTYGIDDFFATVIAMSIILSITLFFDWPKNTGLIYFSIATMFAVKIYYLFTLDPIVGPDEINYYAQLTKYDGNLKGFMMFFFEELKNEHLFMS